MNAAGFSETSVPL